MAITIDWGNTYIINIPQADLTFISGTLYELDVDQFRRTLRALEESAEGMAFPKTHKHNTEITIVGTTYARQVLILTPYSVEFEDGQYSVKLTGANNNIFDVDGGILVQNQVQIISNNSAGLISSGFTSEDQLVLREIWTRLGLNPDDAFTDTPTQMRSDSNDIVVDVTGNGVTSTTQTRQ